MLNVGVFIWFNSIDTWDFVVLYTYKWKRNKNPIRLKSNDVKLMQLKS